MSAITSSLPFQQLPHLLRVPPEPPQHLRRLTHEVEGFDGRSCQHGREGGGEAVAEPGETLVVDDVRLASAEPAHTGHRHVQGHTDDVDILGLCVRERREVEERDSIAEP